MQNTHINPDLGNCDCGQQFNIGSRFDHDADTGQCWNCSDRDIDDMSEDEFITYLNG